MPKKSLELQRNAVRSPSKLELLFGARVACDGVGTCDGTPENKWMCEKYVVEYQDKSKCPNQHRRAHKQKGR